MGLHGPRKFVRINIHRFLWWWVRSCGHMIKSSILLSLQLNTAVESRQKRYRASQQLGRSDSLDKLQMKKMASDILNWTMEEMQLLMHGVFQVNWLSLIIKKYFLLTLSVLYSTNRCRELTNSSVRWCYLDVASNSLWHSHLDFYYLVERISK